MLTTTKDLKGLTIRGSDGEMGTVKEIYFDDQAWVTRYLVVETGGWLSGRDVLISPMSIKGVDWFSKRLDVALTMRQVEHGPDIDTHKPVSRQQEAAFHSYYDYPYYWEGPYMWGTSYYPGGLAAPIYASLDARADRIRREPQDVHLRSSDAVTGYHIEATDGEIGHLDRFVICDESWAIRYLEVATQNWWPGKKVLLAPAWVEAVSWVNSKVFVGVSQQAIKTCEEYLDGTPITREYENRLYFHYGRPPYWLKQADHSAAMAASGSSSRG
jgi:hypothetical protein